MKKLIFALFTSLSACSTTRNPLDDRIIGVWKSNRNLTIPTLRYPEGANPEDMENLKHVFGHLIVTYTKLTSSAVLPPMNESPEWRSETTYRIKKRDKQSITIRYYDYSDKTHKLRKITFEGPDRYWIDLEDIEGREYFDRIKQ